MKYISGIHALNLPCNLDTCGDWHQSGIQWEKPMLLESDGSLFGNYGIELGHKIPYHTERYAVANTIRACLDLLELGLYSVAQGMRDDYICNEAYNQEVFEHVWQMHHLPNWSKIDQFMCKEYKNKWIHFKRSKND